MPVDSDNKVRVPSCLGRVLSRNEFLGGKMVRGKCALSRSLGPSPQESVSVPLSEHIYSSVSTGRQELPQCHYFKLQMRKLWGGEAGVFGEEASGYGLCPYASCNWLLHPAPTSAQGAKMVLTLLNLCW